MRNQEALNQEALEAYKANLPKKDWPEDLVRFEKRVEEIKKELTEGQTNLTLGNGMRVEIKR